MLMVGNDGTPWSPWAKGALRGRAKGAPELDAHQTNADFEVIGHATNKVGKTT